MCGRWVDTEPCVNYECPHNLFWEGLKLNRAKVKITRKALEIGNCCCLIYEPWTLEEIGDIWGLTKKRIKQCEEIAWRQMQRESPHKKLKKPIVSNTLYTQEGSDGE